MSSIRRFRHTLWDLVLAPGPALPQDLKRRVYIGIMAMGAVVQGVFGLVMLFDDFRNGVTQLVFALLCVGTIVLIKQGRAIKAVEILLCLGPFSFNAFHTWHDLIVLQKHETIEFFFTFANYALTFLVLPSSIAFAASGGMLGIYLAMMIYHNVIFHGEVGLGEFGTPAIAQALLLIFLFVSARLRERYHNQLQYQAHHDPLTRLPNRLGFLQRLEKALKPRGRTETRIGILLVDLDNFKEVNDTFGHEVGDQLLLRVTDRLRACCDSEQCTLGRFGGDEFNILVPDAGTLVQVAEGIQAAMRDPFVVQDRQFHVSCSIGMSAGEHGCTPSDLLRQADMAMYQAKREGKATIAHFVPAMEQAARERLKLQTDLRYAMERDEFVLHYQPVMDVRTGRVATVEALLRWEHPERGLLLPGRFLSTAEETGLINPIGHWVLEECCRQLAAWERTLPAEQVPVLAVNLSIRQLEDPFLLPFLTSLLERHGIRPHHLQVEVTESILTNDAAQTSQVLQELKRLGLSVALDDFGTGYSSLGYLSRLPVDVLKIDRSFLFGLQESEQNRAVLTAVIQVGHALRLRVTAEGVETAAQLDQVKRLGFDSVQGFYIARPEPAARVTELLAG